MHPLIQKNRETLTALCSRHGVRRLEIFGSAADVASGAVVNDFDFLVEFQPSSPSAHSNSYFGLLFDLEDTLKQPVDLVELPAVTNPFFLQSIEPHRQVLFAA